MLGDLSLLVLVHLGAASIAIVLGAMIFLLPKGTLIKVTAWYDNTAANRSNPDPNVWVGSGSRTADEMGHAWVNVTYFDDEDYEAEVAKREAAEDSGQ